MKFSVPKPLFKWLVVKSGMKWKCRFRAFHELFPPHEHYSDTLHIMLHSVLKRDLPIYTFRTLGCSTFLSGRSIGKHPCIT